jgi:hypothetical protein
VTSAEHLNEVLQEFHSDHSELMFAGGDPLSEGYEGVVGEEEWQRISGRVTTTPSGEILDRRERFARNLAAQAGWTPVGIGA